MGAVDEDATLTVAAADGVLSNDTDVDGDTLSVTGILNGTTGTATAVVDGAATVITNDYGTLTINSDGSYSFAATGAASQALATGATAQTVFTYTATDGTAPLTSTLTITITGTNDAPVLAPDVGAVDEDATLTVAAADGVLSNDTDVDGDTLSVTGILNGTTGTATAVVDGAATVITNDYGTLTINADGSYSFAATGAASQALATDETAQTVFTYTATDGIGSLTSTLTITITGTNDAPTLTSATASLTEDVDTNGDVAGIQLEASGQLTISDVDSSDSHTVSVTNTAFDDNDLTFTADQLTALQSGQFSIDNDGNWSYSIDNDAIQFLAAGESVTMTYTVITNDGTVDSAPQTVTITLNGTDDGVSLDELDAPIAEIKVSEANLLGGTSPHEPNLTQTGEFRFESVDGLQTLTIHGQEFTLAQLQALNNVDGDVTIPTQYGDLTLTGFNGSATGGTVSYSYTLDTAVDGDAQAGATDAGYTESLTITVVDSDGSEASGTLDIAITDDSPIAINDVDTMAEGEFRATGNVISAEGTDSLTTADKVGADGATITAISFNNVGGSAVEDGFTVAGAYGVLTIHADGSYNYVRTPGSQGGVADVFTYTLTDGDGDARPATLTINIGDSAPTVSIPAAGGVGTTVYEAGLPARGDEPAGSDASSTSETTSGNISFTSKDGLSAISLGGHTLTTVNQTFADGLTARYEYNAATGVGSIIYSYTLLDNTSGDNTSVPFPVVITDADGDSAPAGTLVINIVDDIPTAVLDTNNAEEGELLDVTAANGVLSNDTLGADDAVVTGVAIATADNSAADDVIATGVGSTIQGAYGELTLNADGSYTYQAYPNVTIHADATDSFAYTITDGDGDTSTATLTITLTDSGLVANSTSSEVDEAALSLIGSNPDSDAETTGGTLSATGGVGALTFSFAEGHNGTGAYGTLTINEDGTWSYTLNSPATNDPAANDGTAVNGVDTFTYQVIDENGNFKTNTITINIKDDVPTADVANFTVDNEAGTTSGSWTLNSGADGLGTDASDLETGINVNLLTSLGDNVTLTREDVYNNGVYQGERLTATYDNNGSEDTFFTLYMKADGTYTFDLETPNPVVTESVEFNKKIDGGNSTELWASDFLSTIDTDIRFTSTSNNTVNSSTQGIGVDSNWLDPSESLKATFFDEGKTDVKAVDQVSLTFDSQGNGSGTNLTIQLLSATGTVLHTLTNVIVNHDGTVTINAGDYNLDGFYGINVTSVSGDAVRLSGMSTSVDILPDDQTLNFNTTVIDGDGDIASSNFSVTIDADSQQIQSAIIVGDNNSNIELSSARFVIGDGAGVIAGGDGGDVLVGDAGGNTITTVPGADYNIALIVDTSNSMDEASGTWGKSRLQLAQDALKQLATQLHDHDGTVNITLISFDGDATKNIAINNFDSDHDLQRLVDAIYALHTSGATNYQDAFNEAESWFDSRNSGNSNFINMSFFLTDGNPTTYNNDRSNSGGSTDLNDMQRAIAAFESLTQGNGYTVSANAIGIGNGINSNFLRYFDNTSVVANDVTTTVDSYWDNGFFGWGGHWVYENVTGDVGQAQIINTAAELQAALQNGFDESNPKTVGNDVIQGGNGDDVIFGDVLNTDDLAWTGHAAGSHNGEGLQALQEYLTDVLGHAPNNNEIRDYIEINAVSLNLNDDSRGGDDIIHGGNGNDVIFGQGGNDIINGGNGDDVIYGGMGDDILTGGNGKDTFVWLAGETGTDHVTDFSFNQDKLDISDLLTNWDGQNDTLDNYLHISVEGGNTVISIDANADHTVDQTIILDGSDVSSYGTNSSEWLQGLIDNGNGPLIVQSTQTEQASYTPSSSSDELNHTNKLLQP